MSKPITLPAAVLVVFALSACEPREPAPTVDPRQTTSTEQEAEAALAPPCPATVCRQCEQKATAPAVLRTWAHQLQAPGGVTGAPAFRPLDRGANNAAVGVSITNARWEDSARLRLSFEGCGFAAGENVRVARWIPGPGEHWQVMPSAPHVDHQGQFVELDITSNSAYAIATN
jgi:hypothetical protein